MTKYPYTQIKDASLEKLWDAVSDEIVVTKEAIKHFALASGVKPSVMSLLVERSWDKAYSNDLNIEDHDGEWGSAERNAILDVVHELQGFINFLADIQRAGSSMKTDVQIKDASLEILWEAFYNRMVTSKDDIKHYAKASGMKLPVISLLVERAWETAHSDGIYEVVAELQELVNFVGSLQNAALVD